MAVPLPSHAYLRSKETTVIFFQIGAETSRFLRFAIFAGHLSVHAVNATSKTIGRHPHTAAIFDMITAWKGSFLLSSHQGE